MADDFVAGWRAALAPWRSSLRTVARVRDAITMLRRQKAPLSFTAIARWPGSVDDYVDALVWLVGELLTDPKHFFRSFTIKEPSRGATGQHPPDLSPEREALGVVAISIKLVDPPRPA
jgi:hypothetical protein